MSASAELECTQAVLGLECAWASTGDDSPLWHSVTSSPSGDVVATVGQVLRVGSRGQGPCHLRDAATALVGEGHDPDDVVWRLRRLADGAEMRARFLFTVFRLGQGRLDVHSGGHRPPLVTGPSGRDVMDLRPSPPLGHGSVDAPVWATAAIAPGDTVLLAAGPADQSADVFPDGPLAVRRGDSLVRLCQAAAGVWPGGGRGGTILAVRVTDQL